MPLLRYFITIGALLTALLLLVNFMLAPSKPESSQPAVARVETSFPKPRMTTGSAQDTGSIAPLAPAAETSRDLSKPPTASLTQSGQEVGSSTDAVEPKSTKRRKSTTAKTRVRGQNPEAAGRNDRADPAYSSYAQERPAWQSPAEGTLGPH